MKTTASPTSHLLPASQLLLRQLPRLPGARPLVVCPLADDYCLQLASTHPGMAIFTIDYTVYRRLLAAGVSNARISFGACIPSPDLLGVPPFDSALLFLPKGRALLELLLRQIAAVLPSGAPVFLVGENNAGIRSSKALLQRIIGPISNTVAGRHCALYHSLLAEPAAAVDLDDWVETYSLPVGPHQLRIASLPGVFSHGRLDSGTRLLLSVLDTRSGARLLDFGCGSGVIGAVAQASQPDCQVELVDSQALALVASRFTARLNGFAWQAIFPSDVFSEVNGVYDFIFSNPPFHRGVPTDYRTVTAFLSAAASRLAPAGVLRIVANRFLKYQPLIAESFGNCRIVLENEQYRVYEGVKIHSGA